MRLCRTWLTAELGPEATAKHMVAVSTNLKLVQAFGIDPTNAFGFWDWVGGRYSVTSAVGMVPLSLQYGFDVMEEFLQGMLAHFLLVQCKLAIQLRWHGDFAMSLGMLTVCVHVHLVSVCGTQASACSLFCHTVTAAK